MNETFSFDWAEFTPENLEMFRRLPEYDPEQTYDLTCLGCVRIGDLCFDICVWYVGGNLEFGYNLYAGGVDDGYGYSCREAMATGKYASERDVPEEEQYPYTELDGGAFHDTQTCRLADYPEFVKYAESVFVNYIITRNESTSIDLIGKARQPLHCW